MFKVGEHHFPTKIVIFVVSSRHFFGDPPRDLR